MSATTTSGPGRGNRRRGPARGTHSGHGKNNSGSLPWRRDPEILERLEIVGELYNHPRAQILRVVNQALQAREKAPVSMGTIEKDRQRYLQLKIEDVKATSGYEQRLVEISRIVDETWRAVRRTPEGPQRTGLLVVLLRCVEDRAKLEGSWGRGPGEAGNTLDPGGLGMAPFQQLQSGIIDDVQYATVLRVIARSSNEHLNEPSAPVIDQDPLPPLPPPEPVGTRAGSPLPKPLRVRRGQVEEGPSVVELDPSEYEL